MVLDVPLEGTEPADQEEDDTDADVGEDDAHPDLVGERIHEGKDTWLFFQWSLIRLVRIFMNTVAYEEPR